jgi:hypothetical protein
LADAAAEEQIVSVLGGIIDLLCMTVRQMEKLIEKPAFVDPDAPNHRFRFLHPDAQIFAPDRWQHCVRRSMMQSRVLELQQKRRTITFRYRAD